MPIYNIITEHNGIKKTMPIFMDENLDEMDDKIYFLIKKAEFKELTAEEMAEMLEQTKEILTQLPVKIKVEKMIDNTWTEGLHGIQSGPVIDSNFIHQALGQVSYIKMELTEWEQEKTDSIKLQEINEWAKRLKKKIDVIDPKNDWSNARKYKTPDNPELLTRIEEIKAQCLERQKEHAIKTANLLAESEASVSNQNTTRQPSL